MALLLMDGFDTYADVDDMVRAGWVREAASSNILHTTGGRYGGGAIESNTNTLLWVRGLPSLVAAGGTLIVCFAYWHDGAGGATNTILELRTTLGASLARFTHDTAGAITSNPQSGTALGPTGNVITPNVWHWLEFKITLGTGAADGAIQIRVDNSLIASYTTIDTNTGDPVAGVKIGGSSGTHYVDDLVIMDGTGSTLNDFIGDSKIETLMPNGEGAVMDWSYNVGGTGWQAVDEGTPDDDTSYIFSTTPGQEARFTFANLSEDPDTIHGVQVRYSAKKADAGPRTVRSVINSSTVENTGVTYGLALAYSARHADFFELNPNGSVAWTFAAVNAVEAGVEVVS